MGQDESIGGRHRGGLPCRLRAAPGAGGGERPGRRLGQGLISAYSGLPSHFPGQVLADLAVSIADGATSIMGLKVLRDQPGLFGQVASEPTAWRVLDKVSEDRLPALRAGRAKARAAAWGRGGTRPVW